jgi:hypothetical protein
VVCIVVVGYIVDHYCLMFNRGVVHIVVAAILILTTLSGVTEEWSYCCGCYIVDHYCLMFDRGVVHFVVVGYIVDHYCLMFDRGVVHTVVAATLFPTTISVLTEEWFILL